MEESLKIVTTKPARRVGLFASKGSLDAGKDADLLILDQDLNIYSFRASISSSGFRGIRRGRGRMIST